MSFKTNWTLDETVMPKDMNDIGEGLNNLEDKTKQLNNNKVDKVEGKQLSTEDYTTKEKSKLAGIEEGSNKYVHPKVHPATIIAEDTTHRFVTDEEKNNWNDKAGTEVATTSANGLMSSTDKKKLDSIASGANKYVHPQTHPATMITEDSNHKFMTDAEKNKLAGIATGANNYVHPNSHPATMITEDSTHRFVTDTDKNNWNGKAAGDHNHDNIYLKSSGGTVSGDLKVNNMVRAKSLYFDIDRQWRFKAMGSGGDTKLALKAEVDSKTFYICDSTEKKGVEIFTCQNYADMSVTGSIYARVNLYTPRIKGDGNNDQFYIGPGNCRVDTGSGHLRLYVTPIGVADSGIQILSDGTVNVRVGNVTKHQFLKDGKKVGGTMEIDGTVYGMSPTDSPQTLIEYIEYDVKVEGQAKIQLDPIYAKMISKYAVFSSNPDIKIISKEKDYFIVEGNGLADFEIKGQRKDGEKYFRIMGGFEHGFNEEESI